MWLKAVKYQAEYLYICKRGKNGQKKKQQKEQKEKQN